MFEQKFTGYSYTVSVNGANKVCLKKKHHTSNQNDPMKPICLVIACFQSKKDHLQ